MSDQDQRSLAIRSVLICWAIALLFALVSLMLWSMDVQQLATWFSIIPAISLLASLFAMVTSAYLLSLRSRLTRIVLPTSIVSMCWAIAIAIGV